MPMARSRPSTEPAPDGSLMSMLSVTSSSRRRGATSQRASSVTTSSTRWSSVTLAADRLTATATSTPPARQAAHRASAASSTQAVSGRITPAVLGEGGELARRDQVPLRVLRAHERLHRAHLARGEVDLRLVVEDQLAGGDRTAQLAE